MTKTSVEHPHMAWHDGHVVFFYTLTEVAHFSWKSRELGVGGWGGGSRGGCRTNVPVFDVEETFARTRPQMIERLRYGHVVLVSLLTLDTLGRTGLDSVEEVVYEDDDLLVKLVKVPLVRCHFHSVTAILFLVGDLSLGVGTAVR